MYEMNIIETINQSGFPMKFHICKTLQEHGWTTLTNRYYLDNVSGEKHSIDIMAYKSDFIDDIEFITTLLISCKTSNTDSWCFISKDLNPNRGHERRIPLQYSTKDKRLDFMTNLKKDNIIDIYKDIKFIRDLFNVHKDTISLQQIVEEKDDHRVFPQSYVHLKEPRSNEDINDSIIKTIEACEAEKNLILNSPEKSNKCFNSFYLLSVFDGAMYEDHFNDDGNQQVNPIKNYQYLTKCIVNGKDSYYLVDFMTNDFFHQRLNVYDDIHILNKPLFTSLLDVFYSDIFEDPNKLKVVDKHFRSVMRHIIPWRLSIVTHSDRFDLKPKDINVGYTKKEDVLEIEIYTQPKLTEKDISLLNDDETLKSVTTNALKTYFNYTGEFIFVIGDVLKIGA